MKMRNSKASRAAVKQYRFALWLCSALWSKTQRENGQEESPGRAHQPVPGLGVLIESHCGPQGASSFPGRDPHPWQVSPESLQGSTTHPSRWAKPTQEPEKISPTGCEQMSSFLPCSSFCRAVGVSGLQHILSVLMA